ncbi:MAG: GNAT family N-acetyltransferase [Acidobacteriota bacterium]
MGTLEERHRGGQEVSLRVLDLGAVEARRVERLIRQEGVEWENSLHWRRDHHVRTVSTLLRRRELAGLALVRGKDLVGKVFLGKQGPMRSIEFPYIRPSHRRSGLLELLLDAALSRALETAGTRRVEASFFLLGETDPGMVFLHRGFKALPRQYLVRSLEPESLKRPRRMAASRIELLDWVASTAHLGGLLKAAYVDSDDSCAAEFYRTVSGCTSYLSTLVHGTECGEFQKSLSCLAREPEGAVVGLLLATEISPWTAHVAQLAVHPSCRGKGIGTRLLDRFHGRSLKAGYRYTSLLVSRSNPAREWYLRAGYGAKSTFLSYWWAQPGRSPSR